MKKEISKKLVDLMNIEKFKEALNKYDFITCYKIIEINHLFFDTQKFTMLLFDTGINPLEYMKKIPSYFLAASDIKTFKIPDIIDHIEDHAFSFCEELTNIIIPDSVKIINDEAFEECPSLSKINSEKEGEYIIPDSVESIGGWAFNRCLCLKSLKISNNVKSIGPYAFTSTSDHPMKLTNVTIGSGVLSIGALAFAYCKLLNTIKYNGTKDQWSNIKFGDDWCKNIPATIVHCTDGDIKL